MAIDFNAYGPNLNPNAKKPIFGFTSSGQYDNEFWKDFRSNGGFPTVIERWKEEMQDPNYGGLVKPGSRTFGWRGMADLNTIARQMQQEREFEKMRPVLEQYMAQQKPVQQAPPPAPIPMAQPPQTGIPEGGYQARMDATGAILNNSALARLGLVGNLRYR